MKTHTKFILVTFLLLATACSLCVNSFAAIPHLINYQGRLTDSSGKPVEDKAHSVTFKIYDAESGPGTMTPWEETQSVTTHKGIFNVLLGSVTSLDLAFDKPYYLEIKVGNETLNPRQTITSSGYAMRAEIAEKADQARNSDKVANIEVSITPQANKILPLDSNAKLPASAIALKAYDSGWFPANVGEGYVKNHNLGTTKIIGQIWFSPSPSGSNATTLLSHGWAEERGVTLKYLSATQVRVQVGEGGAAERMCFYALTDSGKEELYNSGYLRIILLALE